MNKPKWSLKLGRKAKDKITGFAGILTGKVEYLYGCAQWGITPGMGKDGKTVDTQFFDEGRIEVIGEGVAAKDVQVKEPGGINRDAPKR